MKTGLLLLVAFSLPLAAQNYTFQVITGCGSETIYPVMMDALGTVVGQAYVSGSDVGYGLLYQNGKCKLYPAADFTGVSETGEIVGLVGNGGTGSYIIRGGNVESLPAYPNGYYTTYCCFDVSNGTLWGNYSPLEVAAYVGFLYAGGKFYSFPYSFGGSGGTYEAQLAAVNRSGVAVGTYYTATTAPGFVYANGKFSYFLYPGSLVTNFYGVNDNNQVIGYAYSNHGENLYFLYDIATGTYTDINLEGNQASLAIGISNTGVIAFQDSATGGLLLATPVN
jgi:hypothetical protein